MPHAHARGFPSPCVWLADCITLVVQDRLILNRSGSGDPELQSYETPSVYCIETRRSLLLGCMETGVPTDKSLEPAG